MKLLITGPNFYNINNMVARAFRDLNHTVSILDWPILSGTIGHRAWLFVLQKLNVLSTPSELSKVRYNLLKETIVEYNKKLLQTVLTKQPDVLLVLKGDIILPRTLKKIRENTMTCTVIWCYDSVLRLNNVLEGGKYYHLFYTFEPTDVQVLDRCGIRASFLPMAYDPYTYYKLKDRKEVRDIAFIGTLGGYPERRKILEALILRYNSLQIDIWGKAWTWYNPFLLYEYKMRRRALGRHVKNYNIPPTEVNKIYNTSRICLNIHHAQSMHGVNPRTFEILGSGSFQLVDCKRILGELFEIGKEIECFKNEKELFDKVEYYLENDSERRRISERGYYNAKRKHTYKSRAKVIMEDLEAICNAL